MQSKSHWRMAVFAPVLATFTFAISVNILPPLVTTISRSIGSSYESFGMVFLLQFVCFALAAFGGGWIVKRYRVSVASLVVWGLALMSVCYLLATQLGSYAAFLIWIVPLGISGGLVQTFSAILISKIERHDSSKLQNFSQLFFSIASIIAPQLAALVLASGLGWQTTFWISGGYMVAATLVFFFASRIAHVQNSVEENSLPQPPENSRFLGDPLLYLFIIALSVYLAVEASNICWIPALFERIYDLSPASAAWRSSVFWAGLTCGRCVILMLPNRWTLWPSLLCGSVCMTVVFVLLALSPNSVFGTVLLFFCGMSAGPMWPVVISISVKVRNESRFTSAVIACSAIGSGVGPAASGLLLRSQGPATFYPVMAAGSVALVLLLWITMKYTHREPPRSMLHNPLETL